MRGLITKYMYIRVPQCLSPRRHRDSPNPSLASECAPPPGTKGEGAHSPEGEGFGGPNSDDCIEKSLALCLLCGVDVRVLVNRDETLLLADQPVITEKEVLNTIERKVSMSSLIFLDVLLRRDGFT